MIDQSYVNKLRGKTNSTALFDKEWEEDGEKHFLYFAFLEQFPDNGVDLTCDSFSGRQWTNELRI